MLNVSGRHQAAYHIPLDMELFLDANGPYNSTTPATAPTRSTSMLSLYSVFNQVSSPLNMAVVGRFAPYFSDVAGYICRVSGYQKKQYELETLREEAGHD